MLCIHSHVAYKLHHTYFSFQMLCMWQRTSAAEQRLQWLLLDDHSLALLAARVKQMA